MMSWDEINEYTSKKYLNDYEWNKNRLMEEEMRFRHKNEYEDPYYNFFRDEREKREDRGYHRPPPHIPITQEKLETLSDEEISALPQSDWGIISAQFPVDLAFVEKFMKAMDWGQLSSNPNLTVDMMRKFKDRLEWDVVCQEHTLTEELIKEFKEVVCWESCIEYQNMSTLFILSLRSYFDEDHFKELFVDKGIITKEDLYFFENLHEARWDLIDL